MVKVPYKPTERPSQWLGGFILEYRSSELLYVADAQSAKVLAWDIDWSRAWKVLVLIHTPVLYDQDLTSLSELHPKGCRWSFRGGGVGVSLNWGLTHCLAICRGASLGALLQMWILLQFFETLFLSFPTKRFIFLFPSSILQFFSPNRWNIEIYILIYALLPRTFITI